MKSYKINKKLNSPFIFTCEHASGHIPLEYLNLGLSLKDLKNSKDLFDPGALDLALSLANTFKASIIQAKFSRLLIDPNRVLNAKSNKNNTYHAAALKTELLIEDSKGERLIPIPANIKIDQEKEEKRRWDKYVKPYYQEVEKLSHELLNKFADVYIFQIHSFYPKYKEDLRRVDIGIINNGSPLAKKQIALLRAKTKLYIGDNEPWGLKSVDGGIFKPLQQQKRIHLIGIDVNNKHLVTKNQITKIKKILVGMISSSII